jgi:hypothetical protein
LQALSHDVTADLVTSLDIWHDVACQYTHYLFGGDLTMNRSCSLINSRRRFLALGFNVAGFLVLAGCGDAEVGSMPPVGKSRKEILGDGPLNDPPKTKTANPK